MKERLIRWMSGEAEEDFETIALEVFNYQYERITAYRNYCLSLRKTPETVLSWEEIPALPTDVFKLPGAKLRSFSDTEINGYFLTSGTSAEIKGRREWNDLDLYSAAVRGAWRGANLPRTDNSWFFSQKVDDAPHSSLVRMFDFLADDRASFLLDGRGSIDLNSFQPTGPVGILGTSIALLNACESEHSWILEKDSWVMETGGSKGLSRSWQADEVRERISKKFGVPHDRILNEYGMTELFSQFYRWGNSKVHKGPPWVGIRVIDVESGKAAAEGKPGYLEVIDLANLECVAALRTQDIAIAHGIRSFELLGRDLNAALRGCSRGIDEVLQR